MTTATLKKLLGDAGAGIDESHGSDRLYKVLSVAITQIKAATAKQTALLSAYNDVVAQFNQLKTDHDALISEFNQLLSDYNAETAADHTDSTASSLSASTASDVTAVSGTVTDNLTIE